MGQLQRRLNVRPGESVRPIWWAEKGTPPEGSVPGPPDWFSRHSKQLDLTFEFPGKRPYGISEGERIIHRRDAQRFGRRLDIGEAACAALDFELSGPDSGERGEGFVQGDQLNHAGGAEEDLVTVEEIVSWGVVPTQRKISGWAVGMVMMFPENSCFPR